MILTFAAVSQYFEKRVAIAMGMMGAGAGVGSLLLPLLVKVLIDKYSFYGALLINGAITLNVIPLSALLRPVARKVLFDKDVHNPAYSTASSQADLIDDEMSVNKDVELPYLSNGKEEKEDIEDFAGQSDGNLPNLDTADDNILMKPERKRGFAWELFKDVRIWVLCLCLMFDDASAMNSNVYLPLLSIEVGGDDINEAFGVSFSGILSSFTAFLWSALWDRGVFRKPISRQIGYSVLGIILGISVASTGLIQNYIFLMAWVIIVKPITATGAMSPYHVMVRDIATPSKFPDALSASGLIKAPATFLTSIVVGKRHLYYTDYLYAQGPKTKNFLS